MRLSISYRRETLVCLFTLVLLLAHVSAAFGQASAFWLDAQERRDDVVVRQNERQIGTLVSPSRLRSIDSESGWLTLLDIYTFSTINSAYATNGPDGALWQGRGVSGIVGGGVVLRHSGLSLTIAPEIWATQNASFETIPSHSSIESEWGDYYTGIDRPQRYGDDASITPWFGQSELRFTHGHFTSALTSENLALGPGRFNPIVLGYGSAGIPRLEIGTFRPVETKIGDLEAATWWGTLIESPYFDSDQSNNNRFTVGYALSYSPPLTTDLVLGLNRVYHSPGDTVNVRKAFPFFAPIFKSSDRIDQTEEDDVTQTVSVTAHWTIPQVGFEVYLEWARNDHTYDLGDFLQNPEHSQAFTYGFQQAFTVFDRDWKVDAELTRLGNNETTTRDSPRPTAPYYRHGVVVQGDTQLGQVLGAYIGPGSNSQTLGLSLYEEWGNAWVRFFRTAYDNDYYLQFFDPAIVRTRDFSNYWVETAWSIGGIYRISQVDIYASIGRALTRNRYWDTNETNWFGSIGAKYEF